MSEPELLPCPFCGSKARLQETIAHAIDVFCTNRECIKRTVVEAEAVRRWNTRTLSEIAIIRAFVERVEKRLPDYDTGRTADAMLKAYRRAVYDELAAMEKEAE